MEIVTVEQGKGEAGIETGGDRTLQEQASQQSPPPEAQVAEEAKLTDAELESRRNEVIASMWGGVKTPKAEAPPPPKPPATPPEPPAAPVTPVEPPSTSPVAAAAPAPVKTTEDVIKETAKAVSSEIAQAMADRQPELPPEEPATEPSLSAEDQREQTIISRMEADNPAMKGKAEEVRKFILAKYDYEKKWQAEHPGRTFNKDDDEHEEFYKGQPELDPEAYEEARIGVMVDERLEARMKPIEEETKNARIEQEAMPVIQSNVIKHLHSMVEGVDPKLASLLMQDGKIVPSKENIARITEADPIAASVLEEVATNQIIPMIDALERSLLPGERHKLDPQRNPLHRQIASHLEQFEKRTQSLPAAEQRRDGKSFITINERDALIQSVNSGPGTAFSKQRALKKIDQAHWFATVDDLENEIVTTVTKRAKDQIKALDDLAARKYKGGQTQAASISAAQTTPPNLPQPSVAGARQKPPSVADASDVVDSVRTSGNGGKSFGETAVETHWRK